jgi:hydrogenase maturation protein HypF
MGRLFDTVAALTGFTREQTFEGQAAMWLEHVARASGDVEPYAFTHANDEIDQRPVLEAIVADLAAHRSVAEIARAFHGAVAAAVVTESRRFTANNVVLSGGVFQNALLVEMLAAALGNALWMNAAVPPNDGGISLGQAACAALAPVQA